MASLGAKIAEAKSITGTGSINPTMVLTDQGKVFEYAVSTQELTIHPVELRVMQGVVGWVMRAWIDGDENSGTHEGYAFISVGSTAETAKISWTSKGGFEFERVSSRGCIDGGYGIDTSIADAVSGTTYHVEIYEWI